MSSGGRVEGRVRFLGPSEKWDLMSGVRFTGLSQDRNCPS